MINSKYTLVSIGLFIKNINEGSFDLWMQKRQEDGPLNGLWEFPGGKIEENEGPLQALKREIEEEVLISPDEYGKIFPFSLYPYTYNDRHVCLHTFLISHSFESLKGKWFTITYDEKSAPYKNKIPTINHKIIDEAAKYIQILKNNKRVNILES